jgi:iron complex transport system ATP-binding protein
LNLTHGSVRIDGQELGGLDASARARKVGFLFQDHTPSFPFTVLDVAAMGRTPYLSTFGTPSRTDIALAEGALDKLGIAHLKDRAYTELSGGERQLVLLSRTLVQQPEVILLDEPTSHLDFANQVRCLKAIGLLASQGVAMVMTTHDPNHATVFSGRVVLMKRGAPIIVGAGAEVLTEGLLSELYGIDVGVFSVPRRASAGDIRFCSPW